MADRPFFAGFDGSGVLRIRQAKAGSDALTAPLNEIVFDSEAYPGNVLGRGEFRLDTGASIPNTPVVFTQPHGLSRKPSYLIATARPEERDSTDPEDWWCFYAANQVSTFGGSVLGKKYCSPFVVEERAVFGGFTTVQTAGWYYSFDATNITIRSYLAVWKRESSGPFFIFTHYRLRVRWLALDL